MSLSKITSRIPGHTRVIQSLGQVKEFLTLPTSMRIYRLLLAGSYLLGALDGVVHVVLETEFAAS